MYILTHDEKQIINSDFVERFCMQKNSQRKMPESKGKAETK